jgi:hypothetical protein
VNQRETIQLFIGTDYRVCRLVIVFPRQWNSSNHQSFGRPLMREEPLSSDAAEIA